LRKAGCSLVPLLGDGRALTLGVARQGLLLKNALLEPANPRFAEFASLLASFGITSISFVGEPQLDELKLLCLVIGRPRSEVWEAGGIKHVLAAAGVGTIRVQAIDPSVFSLTKRLRPERDDDAGDVWLLFVRKLLAGYFSLPPERALELLKAPPSELARQFDAVLAEIPEEARLFTLRALGDFFVKLGQQYESGVIFDDLLDKIGSFIAGLSSKQRTDFLVNLCRSSSATTDLKEQLLNRVPEEAMLEVMRAVADHSDAIPEMLLKLLQRLSSRSTSHPDLDAALTGERAAEKVRVLLRKDEVDKFVPPLYREALIAIVDTDSLPATAIEALDELRTTLDEESVEAAIADTVCEIISAVPNAEQGEGFRRHLAGLTSYYLANGDFPRLEAFVRSILKDEDAAAASAAVINPGFVQEVLDAAALLGREKFPEIRTLIVTVGEPFVVPLMERLFAEENRSLRRFWFDSLGGLGTAVRSAALKRLNDERWFVLRNLLIILRGFNDPDVQRQVRRLASHPHPKVRIEALKSLLHYHDPGVDRLLLQELRVSDPARRLAAIQIAEMSRNPEVVRGLLAVLDGGGIADYGLELKSAAVQALAAIGDVQALPKLKETLASGNLLHPGKHNQLKVEIVRALPRFFTAEVKQILEELARTGGKLIAPVATEALRGLQGRPT
jgi:HEAT repeat protein